MILTLIIVILFICFIALEIITLRRWKGVWRILASLPVITLMLIILNILIGISIDRTSHNLWPFEIVVWSMGGFVFLGLLHLVHRFSNKTPSSKQ